MRRFELKSRNILAAVVVAVLAIGQGARAQDKPPATIHGHVNNAAGQPLSKGEVRLTTDRTSDAKSRKYQYTFPLNTNGDYTGAGIAPGNYVAIVFQDDKSLDFIDSLVLASGDDKTVNFDMSRKEYLDKMTPEEKKALEEYKKKNAEVVSANAKIANLNQLLAEARADNKAGNYDAAVTAMTQATQSKPDESILWVTLGDAQMGSADVAAKAAKAAGKPTDPDTMAKYGAAAASYKKAIELNAASKKPNAETAGAAYNQLGQALAKQGDLTGASQAYEDAAKAQPTMAGSYLFNEAATFYNQGKMPEAAAAADKAIAADPKRADAYYIKGQALIPGASVDPKTQKITAPPGCVDAYQMYLQLAPEGPRAEEVKAILTGIGEKVQSSYKATKKK
jgi:tetratricopeptide (TPR) repeat protein